MTGQPHLVPSPGTDRPEGAVLVLHGGGDRRGGRAVSPTQLSVLRMVPIAARVRRAGRGRLAVHRLLNSTRGWDTRHTPVDDVAWALDRLRDRFGAELPVCLIGHSLGGRAALLSLGHPMVRSVVALAPWVYETDGEGLLVPPGRRALVVHGDGDRVASPQRSALVAERLRGRAEVGYVRVRGGKHAMLRHGRSFDATAADFAAATLLGARPRSPVREVLAGQPRVEV